ncbi:MAG: hypothetical protein IPL39_05545 [Opitutaceae bacterium]|nr:hypothetical protein [Opitutaceae bacterium]
MNNTVVDLDPTDAQTPWILVTAHKTGTASTDCVVRNNLTTRLNTAASTADRIVVDSNLVLPKPPTGYFVAPTACELSSRRRFPRHRPG